MGETRVVGVEVQKMFSSIAKRYDLTNSVLSMGVHFLWRRRLLSFVPKSASSRALDLCTGTGDLIVPLNQCCGCVVGADFCLPMLQAGKMRKDHKQARFVQADALRLPFASGSFDVVTISFGIRNLESLEAGLREIRRVLAPGARLLVLEFGQPKGIFGIIFRFYSSFIIPLVGGFLTGNRAAYEYLPETSKRFPCGDKFAAILNTCGFRTVAAEAQTGGIAFLYVGEAI